MKYPYIGQCQTTNTETNVLYYGQDFCIHMDDKEQKTTNRYNEGAFKNITHDYLQNTYGEVLSHEHAEFIVELAENAGFKFTTGTNEDYPCWFAFVDDLYFFKSKGYARDDNRKQITIPLPPKAESKKWTPDFYELGELPKHFDCVCNKCGGKCCTGQCAIVEFKPNPSVDKWLKARIAYAGDKFTILKSDAGREFSRRNSKLITRKPKTPEEELRDDIEKALNSFIDSDKTTNEHIDEIINLFKKPQ